MHVSMRVNDMIPVILFFGIAWLVQKTNIILDGFEHYLERHNYEDCKKRGNPKAPRNFCLFFLNWKLLFDSMRVRLFLTIDKYYCQNPPLSSCAAIVILFTPVTSFLT